MLFVLTCLRWHELNQTKQTNEVSPWRWYLIWGLYAVQTFLDIFHYQCCRCFITYNKRSKGGLPFWILSIVIYVLESPDSCKIVYPLDLKNIYLAETKNGTLFMGTISQAWLEIIWMRIMTFKLCHIILPKSKMVKLKHLHVVFSWQASSLAKKIFLISNYKISNNALCIRTGIEKVWIGSCTKL